MKIAVIGAGLLGSLFGYALYQAGDNVSFIIRNKTKKGKLNSEGIKLIINNKHSHFFPKCFLAEELDSDFDLIIVLTKTIDTKNALFSIKHLIQPNTVLMSLQNGLDNDLIMENFINNKNIIYGTTMAAADLKDNVIISNGNNITHFMSKNKYSNLLAEKICENLNSSGILCYINVDIEKYVWEKVIFNSAMNSICALMETTPNFFNLSETMKDFLLKVIDESCEIGESNNINLDKNNILKKIAVSCKEHGDHKPSMYQDLMNQKCTEIDSINGALVRYGFKSKIPAKLNEALLKLVRAKEKKLDLL